MVAECGGIAFLPDGRLVAVFHHGEVFFYNPATKAWKLFASGLHDPMRGWPGGFEKLRLWVPALAREARRLGSDLKLRANVVLMRQNVADFAALCSELAEWISHHVALAANRVQPMKKTGSFKARPA